MNTLAGFLRHDLGGGFTLWETMIPKRLVFSAEQFQKLWNLHPATFPEITIHGRPVKTPRWQQAFGVDYHFSGQMSKARPLPPVMMPLISWVRGTIDFRLNGVLLNWYDGARGHYIGRHRDSRINMVQGAPIVMISLGEIRVLRIRLWRNQAQTGKRDFPLRNGSVVVMPYETNLAFTHEVPRFSKYRGLRISITLRAFLTKE